MKNKIFYVLLFLIICACGFKHISNSLKFGGWDYYSKDRQSSIENNAFISNYSFKILNSDDGITKKLSNLEIWSEEKMTNEHHFLFLNPVKLLDGENLIIKQNEENSELIFFYLNNSNKSGKYIQGGRSIIDISSVPKDTIMLQVELKDFDQVKMELTKK